MFAVEMRHITKQFGTLKANDSASLRVSPGEIHALVGENGAGKSTLMKILYGMHKPDEGEIFISGKKVSIDSPAHAIQLGIGMVHQHFMLIPPLSVAENIILGKEPTSLLSFIDRRRAEKLINELSDSYHLQIEPGAKIRELSVGLQQRVEILKILYRKAEILILDEPTPVLTPQEIEELFSTLKNMKNQGKTVILITHKLSEVMEISDNVTVMRHGKVISSLETKSTTKTELSKMMVGRESGTPTEKSASTSGQPLLLVENISCSSDRHVRALKCVSFKIQEGEIFGIAGVEGNGQSELVEALTGLRKIDSGKIELCGIPLTDRRALAFVAHIPEDRIKRGLVLDLSLAENLLLGRQREKILSGKFGLSRKTLDKYAGSAITKYDVRPPNPDARVRSLSGGNQQKLIIAREFSKDAKLIVASQPTRGLDIGAIEFVHNALLSERNKGKAVLLVSSDLEELLALSDRIAVVYEGEIAAVFNSSETNERQIGLYMTGASRQTA